MRTLVLGLLLANLLLWAWSQGLLRPLGWAPAQVGQPQLLRSQLHPDALLLQPPRQIQPRPASAPGSAPAAPSATRYGPAT